MNDTEHKLSLNFFKKTSRKCKIIAHLYCAGADLHLLFNNNTLTQYQSYSNKNNWYVSQFV